MIVPVQAPEGTAPPPSQEDVSAIINSIFNAKTSNQSIDACYALCELLLNTVGFRGLHQYGVIAEVKKGASDKKSGLRRESAQNLLGAIFERFPPRQPISEAAFVLQDGGLIGVALDALADKGSVVRDAAQYGIDALFVSLSPEAMVTALMPTLLEYIKKAGGKWQGVVGALKLLEKMADKAKITIGTTKEEAEEQDILRDIMGSKLAALIPVVENCMLDMKTEVEKQAVKTMTSITSLLTNDDVIPRIPVLVETMHHPSTEAVHKAIHALSMTTFVAVVTSPVLALLTPFLERSLNNPGTPQEVLRQTVVITENLTKLVHDPIEARTFLPMLQPGVKSVVSRASLPEVRELATRALDVMDKAMSLDQKTVVERVSAEDVGKILDKEIMNNGGVADLVTYKLAREYITNMVSEDVNHRAIARIPSKIAPFVKDVLRNPGANDAVAAAVHKFYQEEDERKFGVPEKEDDGEIEIVNADFSLAYGGMLLLSHTNLRLLKGHRYGLCGRNGAGKSTLMRSIAGGKLEGFPSQDVLRTCYVEHNQGEDADISILDFMVKDPTIAKEGRDRISAVLEDFGFTSGPEGRQSQPVGSLSGGWKMKLALARAMLQKADVLLLDEPTNHLDVANIAWLENYLKTHPDITSLIVSHDSGFLDNVTTDIYHYEPGKKLALYKGNLAAFVKVRPEAKSYYTLSASNVQFKFPPPGILSGVKSNTRAIIRMSHASYTYPGAPKPSLTDASCQLTLSSRVAVIGPNGAGKSTLIKMLTGETIPTEGKVEKHPNLRIGYIKQHALEHVEMHLEKTPNQYLQWRYANGDDREVHMKQTRILSEADRIQMDKWVDCGEDIKRQIEALVGRQKHKKTYKYEVKWRGMLPKHNSFMFRDTLTNLGFDKLVQEFDDHEASREGLGYRELQPSVISKHFEDLGLDPDIANHNEIGSLSGGQKVKVVIAGAMWNNPHLLVLDEPTNFLDRDSLGGLAVAIRDFKGGVVMISHNEEFVGALANETWHVEDGRMTHRSSNNIALDRFEDSAPASAVPSGLNTPALSGSVANSAVNSDAEGPQEELKFRAKKKKKMTKKELKEREVRRRLRYIDWLNSPKGTPKPADTDDEAE
ncbi:[NU+] prion formation protein 1 [Cladorrhinum sp. PSN259]|nr:[NU+] prion formation protein 1 [Cladorrhinum sp. PSN259]